MDNCECPVLGSCSFAVRAGGGRVWPLFCIALGTVVPSVSAHPLCSTRSEHFSFLPCAGKSSRDYISFLISTLILYLFCALCMYYQ